MSAPATAAKRAAQQEGHYFVKQNWHLFDAKGQVVGRLAQHIATILMGKHKVGYRHTVDNGDHIVIVNAKDVVFTGKKWEQKVYRKHSGFVGGLKSVSASHWREAFPERVLMHAVRGMIPKTKHKLNQLARLKVFAGPKHTYSDFFPGAPEVKGVEKRGKGDEVAYPIPGLLDNWDFPANMKAVRDQVFASAEYREGTPEEVATERKMIEITRESEEKVKAEAMRLNMEAAKLIRKQVEDDNAKPPGSETLKVEIIPKSKLKKK